MSGIFSRPKVPAAPKAPGEDSAAIAQARIDANRRLANATGRKATILGGGLDNKNAQLKRLLGE